MGRKATILCRLGLFLWWPLNGLGCFEHHFTVKDIVANLVIAHEYKVSAISL